MFFLRRRFDIQRILHNTNCPLYYGKPYPHERALTQSGPAQGFDSMRLGLWYGGQQSLQEPD